QGSLTRSIAPRKRHRQTPYSVADLHHSQVPLLQQIRWTPGAFDFIERGGLKERFRSDLPSAIGGNNQALRNKRRCDRVRSLVRGGLNPCRLAKGMAGRWLRPTTRSCAPLAPSWTSLLGASAISAGRPKHAASPRHPS